MIILLNKNYQLLLSFLQHSAFLPIQLWMLLMESKQEELKVAHHLDNYLIMVAILSP